MLWGVMKYFLRIFSIGLGSLLISTSALSQEAAQANVFNADTSHPELAAAISAFEQVCMPFVLHQTEMDHEHDKLHMAKLMQSRGYAFRSSSQETKRVIVEPKRGPWKPGSNDRERFNPYNEKQNGKPKTTRGQFTVFNGTSMEVVTSDEFITPPLWGPLVIPPKYKQFLVETETYSDLNAPRLTAQIKWNYASQQDPGGQCEISLSQVTMPRSDFTESFIAKDADWIAGANTLTADTPKIKPVSWSQCAEEGEDDFEFKASHKDGTIKLSMKRSDFYEPDLCGSS